MYASIDAETELLQQNKRVLEVFYEEGEITGVSIEENASESMELIYAATYGKIYLGLVDGTGYQAVEDGMVYSPYTQALNTILMMLLRRRHQMRQRHQMKRKPLLKQKQPRRKQEETRYLHGVMIFSRGGMAQLLPPVTYEENFIGRLSERIYAGSGNGVYYRNIHGLFPSLSFFSCQSGSDCFQLQSGSDRSVI